MELKGKALRQLTVEKYVGHYSLEMGFTEKTIKDKRETLQRFLRFLGDKPLTLQNCLSFLHYLYRKDYKISSIRHEMRILKATINFLYKRRYLGENFSGDIPMPRLKRKPLNILPAEIAERVILAGTSPGKGDNSRSRKTKKEHRLALQFALRTGIRNSELRILSGKDINIEEETFFVSSKGGNIDVLPLPRDMIPKLKRRLNRSLLFDVTAETLNTCLKRGGKRLGIDKKITCHSLRHIFCTTLLKADVPLQVVSRLMRHSSIKITDSVYSHYSIGDLKHSLNGQHPLIRQGLTPSEIFSSIQLAIKKTGIEGDGRFQTMIKQDKSSLTVSISMSLED